MRVSTNTKKRRSFALRGGEPPPRNGASAATPRRPLAGAYVGRPARPSAQHHRLDQPARRGGPLNQAFVAVGTHAMGWHARPGSLGAALLLGALCIFLPSTVVAQNSSALRRVQYLCENCLFESDGAPLPIANPSCPGGLRFVPRCSAVRVPATEPRPIKNVSHPTTGSQLRARARDPGRKP